VNFIIKLLLIIVLIPCAVVALFWMLLGIAVFSAALP